MPERTIWESLHRMDHDELRLLASHLDNLADAAKPVAYRIRYWSKLLERSELPRTVLIAPGVVWPSAVAVSIKDYQAVWFMEVDRHRQEALNLSGTQRQGDHWANQTLVNIIVNSCCCEDQIAAAIVRLRACIRWCDLYPAAPDLRWLVDLGEEWRLTEEQRSNVVLAGLAPHRRHVRGGGLFGDIGI